MKLIKTFFQKNNYSKVITLDKEYTERFCSYKQAGGDYIVDFIINIKPTENDFVNFFIIEDEQTNSVYQFILEGIESFFNHEIFNNKVRFANFDIIISNCIYHPVDFKAKMYITLSNKRIKEIIFDNANYNIFKPVIESPSSINNCKKEIFQDTSRLYEKISISKSLPNNLFEKIDLPDSFSIKKEIKNIENEKIFEIYIYKNDFGFRHLNNIKIIISNPKNIDVLFAINEVINKFVEKLHKNKKNITGFNILIDSFDEKVKCFDINYSISDFKNEIYWLLLEIFLRSNEYSSI